MPKVYCAETTCKYNDRNLCRAKTINLSASNIATVYEGRKDFWTCRKYEKSEEYKNLEEMMKKLVNNDA